MTEKGEFIGKKCPICTKGFLAKADDIVSEVEGLIFVEKGTRCTHCGEEFIGEAKAPHAGCPAFWRSHANCPVERHNLHRWGPCVTEADAESM